MTLNISVKINETYITKRKELLERSDLSSLTREQNQLFDKKLEQWAQSFNNDTNSDDMRRAVFCEMIAFMANELIERGDSGPNVRLQTLSPMTLLNGYLVDFGQCIHKSFESKWVTASELIDLHHMNLEEALVKVLASIEDKINKIIATPLKYNNGEAFILNKNNIDRKEEIVFYRTMKALIEEEIGAFIVKPTTFSIFLISFICSFFVFEAYKSFNIFKAYQKAENHFFDHIYNGSFENEKSEEDFFRLKKIYKSLELVVISEITSTRMKEFSLFFHDVSNIKISLENKFKKTVNFNLSKKEFKNKSTVIKGEYLFSGRFNSNYSLEVFFRCHIAEFNAVSLSKKYPVVLNLIQAFYIEKYNSREKSENSMTLSQVIHEQIPLKMNLEESIESIDVLDLCAETDFILSRLNGFDRGFLRFDDRKPIDITALHKYYKYSLIYMSALRLKESLEDDFLDKTQYINFVVFLTNLLNYQDAEFLFNKMPYVISLMFENLKIFDEQHLIFFKNYYSSSNNYLNITIRYYTKILNEFLNIKQQAQKNNADNKREKLLLLLVIAEKMAVQLLAEKNKHKIDEELMEKINDFNKTKNDSDDKVKILGEILTSLKSIENKENENLPKKAIVAPMSKPKSNALKNNIKKDAVQGKKSKTDQKFNEKSESNKGIQKNKPASPSIKANPKKQNESDRVINKDEIKISRAQSNVKKVEPLKKTKKKQRSKKNRAALNQERVNNNEIRLIEPDFNAMKIVEETVEKIIKNDDVTEGNVEEILETRVMVQADENIEVAQNSEVTENLVHNDADPMQEKMRVKNHLLGVYSLFQEEPIAPLRPVERFENVEVLSDIASEKDNPLLKQESNLGSKTVFKIDLDPEVKEILNKLEHCDPTGKVRVFGGYIRDKIHNVSYVDIDLILEGDEKLFFTVLMKSPFSNFRGSKHKLNLMSGEFIYQGKNIHLDISFKNELAPLWDTHGLLLDSEGFIYDPFDILKNYHSIADYKNRDFINPLKLDQTMVTYEFQNDPIKVIRVIVDHIKINKPLSDILVNAIYMSKKWVECLPWSHILSQLQRVCANEDYLVKFLKCANDYRMLTHLFHGAYVTSLSNESIAWISQTSQYMKKLGYENVQACLIAPLLICMFYSPEMVTQDFKNNKDYLSYFSLHCSFGFFKHILSWADAHHIGTIKHWVAELYIGLYVILADGKQINMLEQSEDFVNKLYLKLVDVRNNLNGFFCYGKNKILSFEFFNTMKKEECGFFRNLNYNIQQVKIEQRVPFLIKLLFCYPLWNKGSFTERLTGSVVTMEYSPFQQESLKKIVGEAIDCFSLYDVCVSSSLASYFGPGGIGYFNATDNAPIHSNGLSIQQNQ